MSRKHDAEFDPFHPRLIEMEEMRLRYFIEQPYSAAASRAAQAQWDALQVAKTTVASWRKKEETK